MKLFKKVIADLDMSSWIILSVLGIVILIMAIT